MRQFVVKVDGGLEHIVAFVYVDANSEDEARAAIEARIEDEDDGLEDLEWEPACGLSNLPKIELVRETVNSLAVSK